MKLPRFSYEPGSALAFYEEALGALGALCERTWHDRLQVVAEGYAARLWNEAGALHAQELLFAPADAQAARDATREVFPGCPLTFRVAELLRPAPLMLDKVVLRQDATARAPDAAVLEKLWRVQHPGTRQWRLASEPKPGFHWSLVAVVRCEIQAIDQHWSLHRLALSVPDGETDELLAQQLPFLEAEREPQGVNWSLPRNWRPLLHQAIRREIEPDLQTVRSRQEQYLQREVRRIDEYFAQYEIDLGQRVSRGPAATKVKSGERLAAARAEHARRRTDQVARHEIRVQSHVDALLWVAEPAWQAALEFEEQRTRQAAHGTFVPRARRWFRDTAEKGDLPASERLR